ncbi:MAG: DinB family protein [Terriglobia bacterium]|jgi:uncharacterized damage-inducible protein DinB
MTKNQFYNVVMETYRPGAKLIGMAPTDRLDWRPGPTFMSLGQLICHLSDGLGGAIELLLSGNWPPGEEMEKGMKLENLPSCGVQEALEKLEKDKEVLRKSLEGVSEEDFANKVVTVPWGMKGTVERMSILFLEHFTNHKMQLFTYLKLLGQPVNSDTLYFG